MGQGRAGQEGGYDGARLVGGGGEEGGGRSTSYKLIDN